MAARTAPFFTALTVDALGTGMFVPLSLLYFVRVPKIDLATVGVLLSVAAAMSLPVPVLVGHLVDRFGPKPVVVASHVVQAAAFAGYLAVTGPVTLLLAAVLANAGQRAFWSSVFSLVADLADQTGGGKRPERWFALVGMAQTRRARGGRPAVRAAAGHRHRDRVPADGTRQRGHVPVRRAAGARHP